MADNKQYYYMRLKDNFFDTNEMVVMESMPDGFLYSNILLKLYLRSLRDNGRLMMNNTIPYSPQMIAAITRHKIETVETALKTFQDMGLIEVLDSGAMYMMNIQNYIGKSSTEADRQRDYYNRLVQEKKSRKKSCKESHKISTPELELEIEPELEDPLSSCDDKRAPFDYTSVVESFNSTCHSLPKVRNITEQRKKAIKRAAKQVEDAGGFSALFEKVEASDFLTGRNGGWNGCGFDWILKPANLTKILEGNYDNRQDMEEKPTIYAYPKPEDDHPIDIPEGATLEDILPPTEEESPW